MTRLAPMLDITSAADCCAAAALAHLDCANHALGEATWALRSALSLYRREQVLSTEALAELAVIELQLCSDAFKADEPISILKQLRHAESRIAQLTRVSSRSPMIACDQDAQDL